MERGAGNLAADFLQAQRVSGGAGFLVHHLHDLVCLPGRILKRRVDVLG